MTTVEGYRLRAWGESPRWETIDVGAPKPGEVLVEVEACGVGLTVLNCMNGDLDDSPELLPLTPGHEVVGRVVEAGDEVGSPAIGDRVMAYFYLSCWRCRACLSGRESRCERLAGWYGVHRDGGYAPLTILPAGNAIPLSDDIEAAAASVIPDAVATPVHVCRSRLGLGPGDRVALIGAGGGVGIHMLQVARACGAEVAGLEKGDSKLDLIARFGGVPVDSAEFGSLELGCFDEAPDVVIDLLGTSDSLSWGFEHLGAGGRLCVLTTFRDVELTVDPRQFVFRESSIVGSRYASRAELVEAGAMIARGEVEPVVGATCGPGEVVELHNELRAGALSGRGALVWS